MVTGEIGLMIWPLLWTWLGYNSFPWHHAFSVHNASKAGHRSYETRRDGFRVVLPRERIEPFVERCQEVWNGCKDKIPILIFYLRRELCALFSGVDIGVPAMEYILPSSGKWIIPKIVGKRCDFTPRLFSCDFSGYWQTLLGDGVVPVSSDLFYFDPSVSTADDIGFGGVILMPAWLGPRMIGALYDKVLYEKQTLIRRENGEEVDYDPLNPWNAKQSHFIAMPDGWKSVKSFVTNGKQ
jgi:hypothetical protein